MISFYNPWKKLENQGISGVFRGYNKMRTLTKNGLITWHLCFSDELQNGNIAQK